MIDEKKRIKIIQSSYHDYVFGPMCSIDPEDPRDKFQPHSGIYSPAIRADPQYGKLPIEKLQALQSLGEQMTLHPVAVRALEWWAYTPYVLDYLQTEAQEWLDKLESDPTA